MKRKLTEDWIEKQKPGAAETIIWDEGQKGLFLRVSPTGRKTFGLFYRDETGKQRKPTLGQYGKTKGFIGLGAAREEAIKILAAVNDGHDPQAKKDVPSITEGLEWGLKLSRASQKTRRDYQDRGKFWREFLHKEFPKAKTWADLRPSMLESYVLKLEKLGLARDTIRLRILPVKSVWTRLHADFPEYVSPAPKVLLPKRLPREIECLEPQDVARLLAWLREYRPNLYCMAVLQSLCGLRMLEAANLRAQDVDLKNATITVADTEGHNAKNAYSLRTIPICKEALGALKEAMQGENGVVVVSGPLFLRLPLHKDGERKPWTVEGLSHNWKGVREAITAKPIIIERKNGRKLTTHSDGLGLAVFKDFVGHSLRASFASMAGRLGAKEMILQRYMGHAPTSILTRHYRKVGFDELQEISRLMDGWRGLIEKGAKRQVAEI